MPNDRSDELQDYLDSLRVWAQRAIERRSEWQILFEFLESELETGNLELRSVINWREVQMTDQDSNINQIAYHLNAGRPGDVMEGSIEAALTELLEWRMALMQALGLERKRKPRND